MELKFTVIVDNRRIKLAIFIENVKCVCLYHINQLQTHYNFL